MSIIDTLKKTGVFALAGGKGSRLIDLTKHRAKPAVPFAAKYRIADVVTWAMYHSGLRGINVLVQKNAVSLGDHLANVWPRHPDGGAYYRVIPPEGFKGPLDETERHEYSGTADAVYQNLKYVRRKEHVLIVAGDHIYIADFAKVVDFHVEHDADVTIMAIDVPIEEASQFGVITANDANEVTDFIEKPEHPASSTRDPNKAPCSMGVYVFKIEVLKRYLDDDAHDPLSDHDFGHNIIPKMVADRCKVMAFPFSTMKVPGQKMAYWRDVGTVDAWLDEHYNYCLNDPVLNLFASQNPIGTVLDRTSPLKFGGDSSRGELNAWEDPPDAGYSLVANCNIAGGSSITESKAVFTTISPRVEVHAGCELMGSVLHPNLILEPGCMLKRAIIDTDPLLEVDERFVLPAGTRIGFDRDEDLARGFHITERGAVLVPSDWFAQNELCVEVD